MNAWQRLLEISALRFVANSTSKSEWNGSGEGSVNVAQPASNTITFTEEGSWKSNTGQELDFRNVYRWSLHESGDTISLEHLRFGPDRPVYLFDLGQIDRHTWKSLTPHTCGDDLYSALLVLTNDQIELRWTVEGPDKDEEIQYWYS